MKKTFFAFLLLALPLLVSAQTLRFAYFDYDAVLQSMDDYVQAQASLHQLRTKYDAETRRSEDDFNQKYDEFLDGQRSFAPSIFRKRQAELQEQLDKNIAFKQETEQLLKQAEDDALAPVRQRLDEAVKRVGQEGGYAFVMRATTDTLPYVDPAQGYDITEQLKAVLK